MDNELFVISPTPLFAESKESNDSSLVIKFISKDIKALFTGDISQKVEKYLAKTNSSSLASDILKVPHHGSNNSSYADFIKLVNPSVSVIGVGKNSYGHPRKEVLGRLADINSLVFRTDIDGTIKIAVKKDVKMAISSSRRVGK